ncbi:MAG TPA: hypothetical protein DDX47_05215 [Candidatus Jacksonbacteria bacterium]|nr:hypothetical protein [Candidatus Jacksonbacteria bacterium]HCR15233.1 hypothetical protein [Candidatus Jacksonbacteria bacterium]
MQTDLLWHFGQTFSGVKGQPQSQVPAVAAQEAQLPLQELLISYIHGFDCQPQKNICRQTCLGYNYFKVKNNLIAVFLPAVKKQIKN